VATVLLPFSTPVKSRFLYLNLDICFSKFCGFGYALKAQNSSFVEHHITYTLREWDITVVLEINYIYIILEINLNFLILHNLLEISFII